MIRVNWRINLIHHLSFFVFTATANNFPCVSLCRNFLSLPVPKHSKSQVTAQSGGESTNPNKFYASVRSYYYYYYSRTAPPTKHQKFWGQCSRNSRFGKTGEGRLATGGRRERRGGALNPPLSATHSEWRVCWRALTPHSTPPLPHSKCCHCQVQCPTEEGHKRGQVRGGGMAVWKKRNRRFLTSKAQKGRRNPTKSRGASIHEESNTHSRYERTRAGRVNERPCHLSLFISTPSFTHISNPVLPHSFETMKMVVVREEVCGTEKGATGTYTLWRRRRTAKGALKKLTASNVRGRRERGSLNRRGGGGGSPDFLGAKPKRRSKQVFLLLLLFRFRNRTLLFLLYRPPLPEYLVLVAI